MNDPLGFGHGPLSKLMLLDHHLPSPLPYLTEQTKSRTWTVEKSMQNFFIYLSTYLSIIRFAPSLLTYSILPLIYSLIHRIIHSSIDSSSRI